MCMISLRDERGFTLMELMVASVVTVIVLGGAVALTSQVQNGYRRQLEDSAAEQEGRYALDWIGRYIRGAANDPWSKAVNPGTTDCPAPGTAIAGIQFDPVDDVATPNPDDSIRLMTDANPPDALFGGAAGACTQSGEDVTISLDAATDTIQFLDNNTGDAVSTRTDTVIEDLQFLYRDSSHNLLDSAVPANQALVFYVETRITIRTRTIDASTGEAATRQLSSEVRVRSRQ